MVLVHSYVQFSEGKWPWNHHIHGIFHQENTRSVGPFWPGAFPGPFGPLPLQLSGCTLGACQVVPCQLLAKWAYTLWWKEHAIEHGHRNGWFSQKEVMVTPILDGVMADKLHMYIYIYIHIPMGFIDSADCCKILRHLTPVCYLSIRNTLRQLDDN